MNNDSLHAEWKATKMENARLRNELNDLKKDAERYRFFRGRFDVEGKRYLLSRMMDVSPTNFEPTLDESIDAAILANGVK